MNIKNKFIIAFATWYEKYFSNKANKFLCVSDQMKQDLKNNWGINAITLYDRPLKQASPKLSINKDVFLNKYNEKGLTRD